jgi:hypothetical protein
LQARLDHPTTWKKVANVIYTETRIMNVPYMSTTPAVQTLTRGTAYTMQDYALTNNTLTISSDIVSPQFIDRADLAQCTLTSQMTIADMQGQLLLEYIEAAVLADHASWTNFGDTGGGVLGLSANAITVSITNIDDIIRGVKREIVKANGLTLANKNGMFFVWRPQDFEMLEAFCQANGYVTADSYLKDGLPFEGFRYMNVEHYQSNDFTAGHVFAGVKNLYTVGILSSTWGQIVHTNDPLNISGVGVISRADYGLLTPTKYLPVLYDVNVV